MTKKKVVVILIILAVIGAFVFIFKSLGNRPAPSPEQDLTQDKPTLSKKLKTFTDSSGFKFSYADNLQLTTIETKGPDIYSKLEIVSEDLEGSINITVSQTDLKPFEQWKKASEITLKDSEVKKIKLGDLTAQQFVSDGKTVTVSLDQGVLFTISVTPEDDKNFWKEAYEAVVKTFSLTPPPANAVPEDSSGGSAGDSDIIFEGEEVIE